MDVRVGESMKKAEHRRIDAFELWCWRRLLRVPWPATRSNQSILKEISPEYSLKGLMLKLKLQYFVYLCEELTHWKRPWCWERLKAGEGDNRGWDCWMASPTWWTCIWLSSGSWWWTGKPGMLPSIGLHRVRHDWATELYWALSKWYLLANLQWPAGPVPSIVLLFHSSRIFASSEVLPFWLNPAGSSFLPGRGGACYKSMPGRLALHKLVLCSNWSSFKKHRHCLCYGLRIYFRD